MVLGASAFSFALMSSGAAFTQALEAEAVTRSAEQKKQKQAKRQQAKPQQDAQATAPVDECARADRRRAGAVARYDHGGGLEDRGARDRRAGAGQRRDAGADPGPAAEPAVRYLLQRARRVVPGARRRSRRPSINIRGLQDFGRVAVVVDGARQNYQRTGHNANGSFFLDPELVGGVDVVRGPTANIYGSGAIGGVVSFRTKDINDVVRPGERWGVDMTGSGGTNNARGLGSIFGGVRADPNVDVFGGAVYRTQGNYKDGNGTEIGNTGNEIAAGLMKVTVRPADGHEIKLGGIFQDYQYSIGQFNRGPATDGGAARAVSQGSSVYASDAKNYTGTLTWKYSQAGRQSVRLECDGLRQPHRQRPDQDLPHQHRRRGLLRRRQSRQQHLRLRRRQARLRARYARHRRLQHDALQCRRLAQRGHLRRRCVPGRRERRPTAAAIPTSPRRAACARFPAASCS